MDFSLVANFEPCPILTVSPCNITYHSLKPQATKDIKESYMTYVSTLHANIKKNANRNHERHSKTTSKTFGLFERELAC